MVSFTACSLVAVPLLVLGVEGKKYRCAGEGEEVFGLTYVVHPAGTTGKFLALITQAPIFVVCALTTAVLLTRRLRYASFLMGFLMISLIATLLSKFLKQPRPDGSYRDGFGMPSKHAATMTYLVLYFWILCLFRVTLLPRQPSFATMIKGMCLLLSWTFWALVLYSRIFLGVHTVAQVAAGGLLGAAWSIVWYVVVELGFFQAYGKDWQERIDRLWDSLDIVCHEGPCAVERPDKSR